MAPAETHVPSSGGQLCGEETTRALSRSRDQKPSPLSIPDAYRVYRFTTRRSQLEAAIPDLYDPSQAQGVADRVSNLNEAALLALRR